MAWGCAVDRLDFDDIELTYRAARRAVNGSSSCMPVRSSRGTDRWSSSSTDFSTLTYRRHLRRPDGGGYRPLTVAEDAAICARLMDHVGWPAAHIVGHSYGALVALQLAMDASRAGRLRGPARTRRPGHLQLGSRRRRPAAGDRRLPIRRHRRRDRRLPAPRVRRRLPQPPWTSRSPAPSTRRSPRRTCSSRPRCPPCSSGASGPATPSASRSPCSTCSAPTAPHGSSKAAHSCSPGSPAPNASPFPPPVTS